MCEPANIGAHGVERGKVEFLAGEIEQYRPYPFAQAVTARLVLEQFPQVGIGKTGSVLGKRWHAIGDGIHGRLRTVTVSPRW
jgi:hypothetical protein